YVYFLQGYCAQRDLHSFPTRRSSDLLGGNPVEAAMKLLVFGQTGQVARELQRLAPGAEYLGRDRADLSDPTACAAAIHAFQPARSEEHTSELQSREKLVCRLLLEKKK